MLWVWGSIFVLLICFAVAMFSNMEFHLYFFRQNHNDHAYIDIRGFFGWIKFRYEVPVIKFKNWKDGFLVKTEKVENFRPDSFDQNKGLLNRETIIRFYEKSKLLLANIFNFSEWFTETLTHMRCTKLRWVTYIGIGDAPDTAITTGIVWGLKSSLLGYVQKFIHLDSTPLMAVNPQYNRTHFSTEMSCILKIRLGYAIIAGLLLIVRMMKVKGGVKTWQNILFKA